MSYTSLLTKSDREIAIYDQVSLTVFKLQQVSQECRKTLKRRSQIVHKLDVQSWTFQHFLNGSVSAVCDFLSVNRISSPWWCFIPMPSTIYVPDYTARIKLNVGSKYCCAFQRLHVPIRKFSNISRGHDAALV